jgi:hypothetical protein
VTRSTLMVNHIDHEAMTKKLRETGELNDDFVVTPLAVVRTRDGMATICTEGVGWSINGDTAVIGIASSFVADYIDYSAQTLFDFIAEDKVDLSEFIRTFGDRLDNNFHLWKNAIGETSQD